MANILVKWSGNPTGVSVDPSSLSFIRQAIQAYLFNRTTKPDHLNSLVVTNDCVLLDDVLQAALGAAYSSEWSSVSNKKLKFTVLDSSGEEEEYDLYDAFTYDNLHAPRYYFNEALPGTNPDNLYLPQPATITVQTVIALKTATGPIETVSGDTPPLETGDFANLLDAPPDDAQAPRLLWGLAAINDNDYAGSRFPQNIVSITIE